MTTLKKKTIYLNTADVFEGQSNVNHCDANFDLSRFGLQAEDDQRLSLALVKCIIPTSTAYINDSGNTRVLALNSTEAVSNPNLSADAVISYYITDGPYNPPFKLSAGEVLMAFPFSIAMGLTDLVNILNVGLDFLQEGGTGEAGTRFDIDTHTGLLGVAGNDRLVIDNAFWCKEIGSSQFNVQAKKIADMIGVNLVPSRMSDTGIKPFTSFSNQPAGDTNRQFYSSYPAYIPSEGLLIETDLSFDSFSTSGNGVSSILSNIPTTLGVANHDTELRKQGDEFFILDFREGFIHHDNKSVVDSHKTVGTKNINNLRLKVKGVEDELRTSHNPIQYVLECRWLV